MSNAVLLISNSAEIGGGNRSLLTLYDELVEQGMTPSVACPGDGPMAEACRTRRAPYSVLDYHQPSIREPWATWRGHRAWNRVLARDNPRLIHANDFGSARSVAFSAKRFRAKLICHARFSMRPEYVTWALRKIPAPDAFIFNSRSLQQELGPTVREACPDASQHVVYNAVDLEAFAPSRPQSPEKTRIGILANLVPVKGHMDFLEMARRLLEERPDLEFWIIGEDVLHSGYGDEVRRRAEELGVARQTVFWGHRDDVPDLLAQLEILVCCSTIEPFGRCLIEAMSCSLPTVATRVGGIPEVVVDQETGLLVPPGDPEALAAAVTTLLSDEAMRRRMGASGRKRVEKLFGAERHAEEIRTIYDEVLAMPH